VNAMNEETRLFLRKFLRRPKQVGSLIPSSRFLADGMTEEIPWASVRSVAELGSGTGAVTRTIARKVRPDAKVYLFEKDYRMRSRLIRQYPNFRQAANAANLMRVLEHDGAARLDCVVSCLPFYNFPPSLREELISQILEALKPGGLFVAFQYSLQMKKRLSERFRIEKIKFVPWNVPPAFVYVCRKEEHRSSQDFHIDLSSV